MDYKIYHTYRKNRVNKDNQVTILESIYIQLTLSSKKCDFIYENCMIKF